MDSPPRIVAASLVVRIFNSHGLRRRRYNQAFNKGGPVRVVTAVLVF
jgi:hypothetical protein